MMQRPSETPVRRLPLIPVACYLLALAAWIIDLLTPQLFIAAILLNGPIALSGLALSTRLTAALVIFAEIGNIIAGYVNGVQAHHHWDPIAIGNRMLSAASFLLVGYLTVRAQEFARDAGESGERARIAANEKSLRRALEAVRATLNSDLVMRAVVREACALTDACGTMLIVRGSQLQLPDIYEFRAGSKDSTIERRPLDSPTASLFARAAEQRRVRITTAEDPIARMVLESHDAAELACVPLSTSEHAIVLFVFAKTFPPGTDRLLQAFADGASVALSQAWLFMQLGFRNEEIAAQRNTLEDRNRVIRDIVYALAHDLRTPLTAAAVTAQQALDGAYGTLPEAYREVLRRTLASNADQRRLVETLLLIARFESGESSTRREPVDLRQEAERVLNELLVIASAKNINLTVQAREPLSVAADPAEVRRAIANLVANALEATPAGGTVSIRIVQDGPNAQVVVEDDGYGVPPEQRDQLFQRFSASAKAPGAGTGLGLYIVKLIAEKLHGSVTYEPREPRGSIFTLRFPAMNVSRAAV